ncbi:hypothetical protein DOY81_013169 [Sarcophaga bullata]|nr:hypothetical protein DOY81_013169 [Sarcophaga bullata]
MPTLLKVEPLSPTSLLTPLTTLTTCTSTPPNLTSTSISTSSPSVLPPSSSLASSASASASTTNTTTTTNTSKYNFTTTIPILTVRDNKKNSKFICDKCPHKSYQTYNSLLRHQRVECHKDPQHYLFFCSITYNRYLRSGK